MLNLLNPVVALGSAALGAVKSYFNHKQEVVVAERNLEIAKINAKAKIAEQVHELQQGMMDADTAQILENKNSYFDEVVKITIFGFPFYAMYDPVNFSKFCLTVLDMPIEFKLAWMIVVITTLAGRGLFQPLTGFLKRGK